MIVQALYTFGWRMKIVSSIRNGVYVQEDKECCGTCVNDMSRCIYPRIEQLPSIIS